MSFTGAQGSGNGSKTFMAMAIAAFAGSAAMAPWSVQAAPGDALAPPFVIGPKNDLGDIGASVARNADGTFVVVWVVQNRLLGRRYSSNAQPLDDGFVIDEAATGRGDYSPDVAIDDAGDFVVAWFESGGEITSPSDIGDRPFARRYTADGSAAGAKFPVGPSPDKSYVYYQSVAMNGKGRFVISWTRADLTLSDPVGPGRTFYLETQRRIFAQPFTAAGVAEGQQIVVAATPLGHGPVLPLEGIGGTIESADVAIDADGDFAVAWRERADLLLPLHLQCVGAGFYSGCIFRDDGVQTARLFARRYKADGTSQLQQILVASHVQRPYPRYTIGLGLASLAMDKDGGLVVGWSEHAGAGYDIRTRRFTPKGLPAAAELTIGHVAEDDAPNQVALAPGVNGGFVVAWNSEQYRAGGQVKLRRYAGNDQPLADEADVGYTGYTFGITADRLGNFVVVRSTPDSGTYQNPVRGAIVGQAFEGP